MAEITVFQNESEMLEFLESNGMTRNDETDESHKVEVKDSE